MVHRVRVHTLSQYPTSPRARPGWVAPHAIPATHTAHAIPATHTARRTAAGHVHAAPPSRRDQTHTRKQTKQQNAVWFSKKKNKTVLSVSCKIVSN
eukprot:1981531-Rhodomonas_salina.1